MPNTRSRGQPETFFATWHMASSGLETTIRMASGERSTASRVTEPTMLSFVVTRSSRLMSPVARHAGGDHDDVGALGLVVAVRARDRRLVAEDGRRLVDVEGLALRQALLDVDEHDVGVVAPRDLLRGGRADVACADDGDLASHTRTPIRSMIASATSLVPTAVGSSRVGFMSYVTCLALRDDGGDRALEAVGRLPLVQVAQHHHAGEHHRHRVDPVLAGVLRRGAVRRLEDGGVGAEVAAGREAEPADQAGGEVGDDVPVEVRADEHVVLLRPLHELHRQVVDDPVFELDVRRSRRDLAGDAEVEPVGELHDVGLVHGRDLAAAVPARVVEGELDDSARAGDRDRLQRDAGVRADRARAVIVEPPISSRVSSVPSSNSMPA